MKAVTRWGLVAAGTLAIAGGALAQPLIVPPGRWWERPRIAGELGLGEEQRHNLDSVALAHAKTMVDLKAEVEKGELDLRVAADAEPFDAKRVRGAFTALQQRRVRLEKERFELLLKVREVLTTDQWKKLTRFVQERLRREDAEVGAPGNPAAPQRPRPRPFR